MRAAMPDDLIGHLYDAAVDARLWQGMAGRIASAFDSTSTVVKFHGAAGDVELLETTDNMIVPEQRREWAEDWHRRDLWVHRTVAHGMDKIVTDDMLVTPEEQRSSGFYGEWLAAFDIFHVVGGAFTLGEGAVGVLGIHRPREAAAYGARDRHRTALLLPHLARAVRVGRHLTTAGLAQAAALDALDRLDTGVLVLDRRRRIIHANAPAEESLRHNPDLGVLHGRFHLRDPLLQDRFALALRAATTAAAGGLPDRAPAALAIPRAGRLPLTLSVAPLRPRWSRGFDPGPMALVFLRDPERPTLHLDRLRELFGLTPTEAVIAADLGAGKSPEDIARRQHINISTVRWHLKSILSKTGTARQAEAATLLARSVAALPEWSST
jgi:DNA-binding CsgD family transcriptional regulator